jgi:AcrR family transcriptional regulator
MKPEKLKNQTKPKRQDIIAAVAMHLLRDGFRNSGLRALAASVGISDRMVMYYFETKEELIEEALSFLAQGFSSGLDQLLPQKKASGAKIVEVLASSSLADESAPMLKLWFEIVGLAVRGDQPYRKISNLFLNEWIEWIESKLDQKQRHRAASLLAQIEGEVLIKLLRNP